MQDWLSSVSLTHYGNFTPSPPCLCATPSSLLFPQCPTEKLQLPTALPLQHPPDFCPFPITKPINPHTHFQICRPALVFHSAHITSPPAHQYLLHTAFISILKLTLHPYISIFSTFPLSTASPASFSLPFQPDKEQGCPECWGDVSPLLGWLAGPRWLAKGHTPQSGTECTVTASPTPGQAKCFSGSHLLPLHINIVWACDHNRYVWLKIANGLKSYERTDINRKWGCTSLMLLRNQAKKTQFIFCPTSPPPPSFQFRWDHSTSLISPPTWFFSGWLL